MEVWDVLYKYQEENFLDKREKKDILYYKEWKYIDADRPETVLL